MVRILPRASFSLRPPPRFRSTRGGREQTPRKGSSIAVPCDRFGKWNNGSPEIRGCGDEASRSLRRSTILQFHNNVTEYFQFDSRSQSVKTRLRLNTP